MEFRLLLPLLAAPSLLSGCGPADDPHGQSPQAPASPSAQAEAAPSTDSAPLPDDPFLWLEEVEGEKALQWVADRNAASDAALGAGAQYEALFAEALDILDSDARIPYGSLRGGYVYNFWRDETHIRGLWRRASLESYKTEAPDWEPILSIDALAEREGENWVFKGADCLPPAYERCMVRLSRGGKDAAVQREFSIADKGFVDGGFEIAEAKSGVAWADEDTLLVGTDWGEGSLTASGYARIVKRWRRGAPLADAETLFEGEAADVSVSAATSHDAGAATSFIIRSKTFFESEIHILKDGLKDGGLVRLPLPPRASIAAIFRGRALVTLQEPWTHQGTAYAKGDLVALDLNDLGAELVYAPGPRQAVQGVAAAKDAVYVQILDNVAGKIAAFTPTETGWARRDLALPENGIVSIVSANSDRSDLMVRFNSPVRPDTLFYMDPAGAITPIKSLPALFDASGVVVEQREAVSTDGTAIPYFVIGKAEAIEPGAGAPVHLYAYGGFEIPLLPGYSATTGRLWLERGGVYVIANIRGGGEFGPAWHQAGLKTNRQIIYDDFYAVAEALIADGVATPQTLGISGGSNGGLLMGVALTQRPDLFGAVSILVPLLDMLRYDRLLAGASWVGEFGDPANAEERAFLAGISPYHNIDPDADYPTPLIYTSTKDDRVHPGHARKFAARLKEYGHPFYYYENTEGGHAGAANNRQTAKRLALMYNYMLRELTPAQ